MSDVDAVVVGSGPNGLACAIALAQKGMRVEVREACARLGGGLRSEALTEPGFVHDLCSSIHPMGIGSPFFASLELDKHGLEWVHPECPVAHSFVDAPAVCLEREVDATAEALGDDARAYQKLFAPLTKGWGALQDDALGPFPFPPRHPLFMASFGLKALRSGRGLARSWFRTETARALLAGICAHSVLPLDRCPSAGVGLMLGTAGHACGWPMPKGGAQAFADALASVLVSHRGRVIVDAPVTSLAELPKEAPVIFDTSPAEMVAIAGDALPPSYVRALSRFEYGPGVCKVDYALSEPIPWRSERCLRAGTVHVGGTLDDVCDAEAAPWRGELATEPFLLVTQPTLFDPSRAPEGKHVAWAYCHVPHGCDQDVTARMEAVLERHAPGFADVVIARHVTTAPQQALKNSNLIGGDLTGGAATLAQLFTRPVARWSPYTTPNSRLFLCSASTPPGGGVHGMCGWHAARAVLRRYG